MARSRHGRRGSWRFALTAFVAASLVMLALGPASGVAQAVPRASVGPGAVSQAEPPFWCQFIPPELRPFVSECAGSGGDPGEPGSEVNEFFQATGPSAVTTERVSGPSPVGTVDLFHPTDLGANGAEHPILIWSTPGDGAVGGGTPDLYTDALTHLASWGFVVVATGSPDSGTLLLDAAEWLIEQDDELFDGSLDTDSIGVFGHSQGAAASIGATVNTPDGLIDSTVTIALPDPIWWGTPVPNVSQVTTPVFFITATGDSVVSSAGAQQDWFNQTAGPAAKASFVFPDPTGGFEAHNIIQNEGDPTAYAGYITAWFKFTLEGDDFARDAFVGDPPQINTDAGWTNQQQKGLS